MRMRALALPLWCVVLAFLATPVCGGGKKEIKWEMGVGYAGYFFQASGLGEEARNNALGMLDMRVPLRLIDIENINTNSQHNEVLPSAEVQNLRNYVFTPQSRGGPDPPLEKDDKFPIIGIYHLLPNVLVDAGPLVFDGLPIEYQIARMVWETDRLPAAYVEAANNMDEVWVSSNYTADTFKSSGVTKPIYVIPQSADHLLFHPNYTHPARLERENGDCVFLSVFDFSPRKGWDVLVEAFVSEFGADSNETLVLKVSSAPKNEIEDKIAQHLKNKELLEEATMPPNILVIDENLDQDGLVALYDRADVFVLPTRGEGWGRTIMEAMLLELPVIATNWSGPTQFLTAENSFPLNYELTSTAGGHMFAPQDEPHQWAEPSLTHVKELMRHTCEELETLPHIGTKARQDIIASYTRKKVTKQIARRLLLIQKKLKKRADAAKTSSAETGEL